MNAAAEMQRCRNAEMQKCIDVTAEMPAII
jgi:hypothetical protein